MQAQVVTLPPRPIVSYDLDSLVYMSPQIVEGQLEKKDTAIKRSNNYIDVWDVKISNSICGNLKAGQLIKVVISEFTRVTDCGFSSSDSLKEGDSMFLFLNDHPDNHANISITGDIPAFADGIATKGEFYWPVPSGLRIVMGDKVIFYQNENPQRYPAVLEGTATNTAISTVAQLREQILESIPQVEKWKSLLERESTVQDIPLLLQILRERKENRKFWYKDRISAIASERLVGLHDIPSLLEALKVHGETFELVNGFGTPSGLEFLMAKIEDDNETSADRIKWTSFLGEAATNSKEHNLTRIARLITSDQTNPDLRGALLKYLQIPIWTFKNSDQKDAVDATSILESISANSNSEEMKFQIDVAVAAIQGNLQGTNLPPVISIVRASKPTEIWTKTPTNQLAFGFNYFILKQGHWTVRLALVNLNDGRKWTLPTAGNNSVRASLTAMASGGGDDRIELPKDLPHGRYRVFYEFLENGNIESSSHFFETDL